MPATYDTLATTTLSSPQTTVTFSGISGSYRYLRFVIASQSPQGGSGWAQRFYCNSDTGSNYDTGYFYSYGTSAASISPQYANSNGAFAGFQGNVTTNTQATTIIDFFDYANTSVYKQGLFKNGACDVASNDHAVMSGVFQWRNTAAITSVTFFDQAGNIFNTGSVFSLYGIVSP